ncbi:RNA polymerase alpha subunit C-terminal domain-containing protein [Halobacillus litoralis]|uniref:Uncharacterized protein n=1 Tax=Halobacillus litoralis TaxID=45668 RepID=A0A410MIE5_9BACI|nr:RNA polymerase alpha subunit C-terminal domain-containing protein [Halobacillus litoralis]QAS54415.1 hypothetical protein HLI_20430 [Halobacillus litoralis]
MTTSNKESRTCSQGHTYYKSSACPVCPICEDEQKPDQGFLSKLSAPARRALENHDIHSLQDLSTLSEKEVLKFHGMGPASLPILKKALDSEGLTFRLP